MRKYICCHVVFHYMCWVPQMNFLVATFWQTPTALLIPGYGLWYMMTSSNGNIFRVTCHFCWEFIGSGEFPHKDQWRGALMGFFYLRPSKQLWGWWFQTPSCPLRRHCNDNQITAPYRWCRTVIDVLQKLKMQTHYRVSIICKYRLRKNPFKVKSSHDSKVHMANMGPTRDWQDPGGAHVGPMDLAIWVFMYRKSPHCILIHNNAAKLKMWKIQKIPERNICMHHLYVYCPFQLHI